ncbi:transporter substrate-binding domain-containing protein [Duganella sp. LX20W]|uniref:Transporter substrate-binding domain-containing protein n=1 Tax=Rugamonas brunnea TaxID=2758569 RepID=A0A7W2EQP0_9BURK|nr:transporter substrate-binding domain-containing protein [Rugamonas brunnea]MBA5636878.1 transporter substrate-binding domain-containing protein [Rugamonas brunnea]
MSVRPPLFTLVLALALAAPAAPAATAGYVCPAVTRVGLSDLGYASYREDGRYRGTAVDLVEELGRRTGCRFQFEWYPRGRLFAEFSANRVDLVMSSLADSTRDQAGRWMPYAYTRFELVLNRRAGGGYASLAEFVEQGTGRLNVTRGVYYPPAVQRQLDRLQQTGRLEYVNDFDTAFRKIQAGRADGTLAPLVIHLWHSRRLGVGEDMAHYEVAESPRSMSGAYASRANVAPELQQAFSAAFRAMVADGTVQAIYGRYVGADLARQIFAGGTREILDGYLP